VLKVVDFSKKEFSKNFKKTLDKGNHCCYVLICCEEPSLDGKMEVEMIYEGDVCLAAYLLEHAQGLIHQNLENSASFP
jgi:hypothetical protein